MAAARFARFAMIYLIFNGLILQCAGVLPRYFPGLNNDHVGRDELIEHYFHLGLGYDEILLFLLMLHGITLSIRQLKRILRHRGLGRRANRSDPRQVYQAIEEELRGSGSTIGYRQMTQRLVLDYRLVVDKETVRELLKILDPEGVATRSRHRLRRRQYRTKGPNHVWHIDGYDKLKPFGFVYTVPLTATAGALCAQYFVDCIRQIGGTARIIRGDGGTENVYVAALQRFFRRDGEDIWAEDNSFLYGKSVSNQRIEAWWGILRKGCSDWWIRFFKDMRDCGLYCDDDVVQVECLKFCFMPVIRNELHKVAILWNLHKIRPSTNAESPSGRPDMLYFLPDVTGAEDLKEDIDLDDIDLAEQRCCYRCPESGCVDEFTQLVSIIMQEQNLNMPETAEEAVMLYSTLLESIDDLL
ncbi:hypothetical protein OS493_016362 [Desmophyllum pertusum]|uniref:Integrase core domain-containing protein n=1 Tax=Desmophyllum pertusum TaxID=174260 RepID=A0A9X0D4E4_9CNID|nr:hypothetical protein OS493_016362 [Desmophyllum pertusum]